MTHAATFAHLTRFSASIGDDPIDRRVMIGSNTPKEAACYAARHATVGEIITVIGPKGGVTNWRAVRVGIIGKVQQVTR